MKTLVAALLVVFVFAAVLQAEEPEPKWYAIILVGASVKPGSGPEFKTSFDTTIQGARTRGLTLTAVRSRVNEISKMPRRKTGRPTPGTFDKFTGSCIINALTTADVIYRLHRELLELRQNPNFLRGQISVRFRTMRQLP